MFGYIYSSMKETADIVATEHADKEYIWLLKALKFL